MLERILAKYVGVGPQYTSYPTVPAWTTDFGADDHSRALREFHGESEISIYTHIPFCASLCHFCACNRVITRDKDLPERFLTAIERELDTVRDLLPESRECEQLHWGGGTPTHLEPAQIDRLYRMTTDRFKLVSNAEISIEVDPRVTTPDHLDALYAANQPPTRNACLDESHLSRPVPGGREPIGNGSMIKVHLRPWTSLRESLPQPNT